MVAFHGQMGMFTRALTYILSHGADGLAQVAEDSVLNANYILRSLEDVLDAPFAHSGPCMHEAIFSDKGFAEGFSTIDVAKALIDEGFHPMTMYFPLVVHGAMLVEPTETESKANLDQFIAALRSIAERARAGDPALKAAPVYRAAPPARRDAGGTEAGAHLQQSGARRFLDRARRPFRRGLMAEPSFPPYNVGDLGKGVRRQAPAAARNVGPIGDVLAEWLPADRAGARNRQRDRRACAGLRPALPRSRLAAERSGPGSTCIDRGVAGRRAGQPQAAVAAGCLRGRLAGGRRPMRSCASTWSTSVRGKRRWACSTGLNACCQMARH